MNVTNTQNTAMQTAQTAKTGAESTLGKDAFLKILVTQMKNQNPLEPLKDTEFIGQMAQFSSLEQLTNLNTTMNTFVGGQGSASLTDHANLIGNKIFWEREVNGQTESGEGIVKAIAMKNGELTVELEGDGPKLPINTIQRIEKYIPQVTETV
ncbi:flagellar hook assembly protein FlgD [Planococcus koreensis]|uniref:flagellar hook assembly protein FlgD n=1 Tax=Planococcus koreensis TaxID=112331 RepID=UPI0039FBAE30